MKYKVLVLTNRVKVEIKNDFLKAQDYIKRHHDFEVDFEYKEVDIKVSTTLFLQKMDAFWFGTTGVKEQIKPLVEEGKYHCVVFAWDMMESPLMTLDQKKFILTSWSTWRPLYQETEFIELVTSPFNDKIDHIYKSIIHELYHSFVKRAKRNGANILDVMDSMEVNGEMVNYYKNHDPEAGDGNFAFQRGILKPHTEKVLYMKQPPKVIKSNFHKAVRVILDIEGGYVNDKNDDGGETNMGITKKSYPHLDIKNITEAEAVAIYKTDFWDKVKGDALPYGIALQVFDMAVNAGVVPASKLLQGVVGAKDDGIIGPMTLKAVKSFEGDINFSYLIERIRFYFSRKKFPFFGTGWLRRASKVYKLTN